MKFSMTMGTVAGRVSSASEEQHHVAIRMARKLSGGTARRPLWEVCAR